MNYRHLFHAGNFADVFKHSILVFLLDLLRKKNKPFCYIDTHAGAGLYDLKSDASAKTMEYITGIKKLLDAEEIIPELKIYIDLVKNCQPVNHLSFYPGSPFLANSMSDEKNPLILNEWHPEELQQLKFILRKNPHIHFHHRDAYEFLPAILPPNPRRGLILIDGPFEKTDEFQSIEKVINKSMKRFAEGIYMIWYPIVSERYQTFVKHFTHSHFKSILVSELVLDKIYFTKTKLIGCGVIIINPPWKCENTIEKIPTFLWKLFTDGSKKGFSRTQMFTET